jgi:hypothetical protein
LAGTVKEKGRNRSKTFQFSFLFGIHLAAYKFLTLYICGDAARLMPRKEIEEVFVFV